MGTIKSDRLLWPTIAVLNPLASGLAGRFCRRSTSWFNHRFHPNGRWAAGLGPVSSRSVQDAPLDDRRHRPSAQGHRWFLRVTTLALLCASMPVAGHATVYEYTRDGRVVVRQSPDPAAPPQMASPARVPASRAAYRTMAEQVALRHAGGAGLRRAGLDALTFSRVFVELVRAESGFDPRALSPKGAQGLGQLMPDTARLLGVRDAWDPAQNLDGAARYFSAQLERFGDVSLALAAYNAGPHRVVEYGGIPLFRETRAYVARITAAVAQGQTVNPMPALPGAEQTILSTRSPNKDLSVWQY